MATNESVANSIKIWAFPTLVTCLSVMIWTDVREIQSDVKHLMAESNISGTKIEGVEARVNKLEQVVFLDKLAKTSDEPKKETNQQQVLVAVLKNDDQDNNGKKKQLLNF
jgi:vacuolar-type H+-ATPase subunit I/STV1